MTDDAEKNGKGRFWDQVGCGLMILLVCLGLSTCTVVAKWTGAGNGVAKFFSDARNDR